MRIAFPFSLLAFLLSGAPIIAADTTRFSAKGRQVLLDDQRFFMRGVCYQPTPIGEDPASSQAHGDYYTDEYKVLYERDLTNLRAIGVNTVRNYAWNVKADHEHFLDRLWNKGEQPIFLLLNKYISSSTQWTDEAAVEQILKNYISIAESTSKHPAVLGYAIGNELNAKAGSEAALWKALDRIAAAIKKIAPDKLVTVPLIDRLDDVRTNDKVMEHLDCWSLQIYRGATFGRLFRDYQRASEKPLFITEFGIDAFDTNKGAEQADNAREQAEVAESLGRQLENERDVVSGGCLFSYSDEWWKAAGSPSEHDGGGHKNTAFPDGQMNEEWFGLFRVRDDGDKPDILEPRAAVERLKKLWSPAARARAASPAPRTGVLVPERDWTNSEGKKLRAILVSIGADGLGVFRRPDGSRFDYSVSKLSPEDQQVIEKASNIQKPGQ